MKLSKSLPLLFAICITPAFAFSSGPYLGVQGPLARFDTGNGLKNLASTIHDLNIVASPTTVNRGKSHSYGNLGVRGFLGWRFCPFISIEGGFSYYKPNRYKANYNASGKTSSADIKLDATSKVQAWDLIAKLSLPLAFLTQSLQNWSIYAKGGIAYVITQINPGIAVGGSTTSPVTQIGSTQSEEITPTYGAGIAYIFNPNFTLDLSWFALLGQNKVKLAMSNGKYVLKNLDKVVPTANMFAFGITYNFTNLF